MIPCINNNTRFKSRLNEIHSGNDSQVKCFHGAGKIVGDEYPLGDRAQYKYAHEITENGTC